MQRTEDVFEMFAFAVRINTINYFKNFSVKKGKLPTKRKLDEKLSNQRQINVLQKYYVSFIWNRS